jgi:hypothetical protein
MLIILKLEGDVHEMKIQLYQPFIANIGSSVHGICVRLRTLIDIGITIEIINKFTLDEGCF